MLGVVVAILLVFIFLIALSFYKRSKTKKNGILLIGLCDAGKTLIFARLVFKKFVQTHTSVKENVDDYVVGSTSLKIIDVPGHERLRYRYFDQFKSVARGIVFVIDSATVQKDIKDVAEFLYICLTDNYVASNMPPVLILCNKQAEITAKGSTVIKLILEKEINIVRTTKSNQLESIGKNTDSTFLGKEGMDFEFSHLHSMRINFADCSAIIDHDEEKYDLAELEKWIESLI